MRSSRAMLQRLVPAVVAAILLVIVPGRAGVLFAQETLGLQRPARLAEVVADRAPSDDRHEKHVLRFAVAEKIGKEFFRCAERKDKARSIHILDQFGSTIYAARMDGQIADNIDVARMKAEAALYFRESTAIWLQRARDEHQVALLLARRGQFTSPVGLPIIVEDQLLGTVGIGGASGDCAHEALTAVLGPQPPLVPVPAQ